MSTNSSTDQENKCEKITMGVPGNFSSICELIASCKPIGDNSISPFDYVMIQLRSSGPIRTHLSNHIKNYNKLRRKLHKHCVNCEECNNKIWQYCQIVSPAHICNKMMPVN